MSLVTVIKSLNFRIFSVMVLGIFSGLPLSLTASTLFIWLTELGISKTEIGFFSYLGVFYSSKFLWSPIIDAVKLPILNRFGRRKSWMLITVFLISIAIYALGHSDPINGLPSFLMCCFAVSFLSANLDVVIDAYRVEILDDNEQAMGATMATFGYRIGMLISGALALILADYFSWDFVYSFCAIVMFSGMVFVLTLKEPEDISVDLKQLTFKEKFNQTVVKPFSSLIKRDNAVIRVLFILVFILGDALAGTMTQPMLIDIEFTKTEIAAIVKTYGLIATLAGSFFIGILCLRIGILKTLYFAGIMQMISNLGFLVQLEYGHNIPVLMAVISIENFAAGAGGTALVAYISSLCSKEFTATHYALLSSIAVTGRTIFSGPSGILVDSYGWSQFFIFTIFASIPGLILLMILSAKTSKIESRAVAPN